MKDRPEPVRSVIMVAAEPNRAFRSVSRTVLGILKEGQLAGRCRMLEARDYLGSVALDAIADRPETPILTAEEALLEELALTPPVALVAMDPVAAVLVGRWAQALEGGPLTIGLVGSLWLDPLWRVARLDRLIVPDQSTAREFYDAGRAAEGLVPIGLGVCGRFGAGVREGRVDCRRALGLPTDRSVLLLVTESLFADEVTPWLRAAVVDPPITVMVDAAGDRLALVEARRAFAELGLQGRVFGRVDEAGLYWGSADRVVARALDNLITRALAFRCPLWAIRPSDARQRGIVAGLEKWQAGTAIPDAAALAERLAAPGWDAPLDVSRLEAVAGAAVPQRIAEAITQMVAERGPG